MTLRDRFVGQSGALQRTWELVKNQLSYREAVALLNARVHHVAYE